MRSIKLSRGFAVDGRWYEVSVPWRQTIAERRNLICNEARTRLDCKVVPS